jgi:hypothetical protein
MARKNRRERLNLEISMFAECTLYGTLGKHWAVKEIGKRTDVCRVSTKGHSANLGGKQIFTREKLAAKI